MHARKDIYDWLARLFTQLAVGGYHRKAMMQLLLLLTFCCTLTAGNGKEAKTPTLRLLVLVPNQSPYQEGVLRAAAKLAVDKINMRDDILVGYNLDLVQEDTETCNQRLVTEALGNFVRSVTDRDLNIVGVVGLLCSTVTQAVSPLAIPERPEIDLLQISAGATSPVFTNETEYPRLYRMIPSSAVYNDAVLALMTEFQWRRISVVQDTTLVRHTTTADDFVRKVKGRSELNLVFLGDVTPTFPTSPIQSLVQKAARVIYASVTASEACGLLCESYWSGRRWPEFVWLFRDLSFEELMQSTENCSNDTMLRALEGVFFLQYSSPNSSTTLVSGQTYTEYHMELQEHLPGAKENRNANALHDSIWAFALALNNSRLEELESQGSKNNVTTDVERNLRAIKFTGALGDIVFNDKREVVTVVDIFHVSDGKQINAGQYNPLSGNVTIQLPPKRIPKDDFEESFDRGTFGLVIATLVVIIVLFIFTTIILFLMCYFWNKPSVKATSPFLNLLILGGCYMLYIGCFIASVRELIDLTYYGPLCQAQLWFCTIGLELICSALFMRLLRIYRIFFFIFEKPGKLWSNQSMVAFTFIPVAVLILVMALWSAVDPIVTDYSQPDFDPMSDPPNYIVRVSCRSNALVILLPCILYGVNGVTVLAVAVLATLTRKVHFDYFRDSKQVNAFVFSTVFCVFIWLPYVLIFSYLIPIPPVNYVFTVVSFLVVPFLCKVFLFAPKIWLAKHEKRRTRRQVSKASISNTFFAKQNSFILQSSRSSPRPTNQHSQLEHTETTIIFVSCL